MASDDFLDAFIVGGGPTEECDFCGNVFYSTTSLEDDELQWYEERRVKKPNKYFPEPYDCIEFYVIDNKRYVYGCSCNGMDVYETFIWEHRDRILRYIETRSKKNYNAALLDKQATERAIEEHKAAAKVAEQLTLAQNVLAKTKDYMR